MASEHYEQVQIVAALLQHGNNHTINHHHQQQQCSSVHHDESLTWNCNGNSNADDGLAQEQQLQNHHDDYESPPPPDKKRKKQCTIDGCTNNVVRSGVCQRHGAKPKICSVDNCSTQVRKGGMCKRHWNEANASYSNANEGSIESEEAFVNDGDARMGSGATQSSPPKDKRLCRVEGCTNLIIRSGVCQRHGAKPKICCVDNCTTHARTRKGGMCQKHWSEIHKQPKDVSKENAINTEPSKEKSAVNENDADDATNTKPRKKYKRAICTHEGCTRNSVQNGVCIQHGATNTKSFCKFIIVTDNTAARATKTSVNGDGSTMAAATPNEQQQQKRVLFTHTSTQCTKRAYKNGYCHKHQPIKVPCSYKDSTTGEPCTNIAQKRGLCDKHVGKRKPPCKIEGCANLAIRRSVCQRHGGKPKNCSVEGCSNQSKRNGVCVKHGARHIQCNVVGCEKKVQNLGVCFAHGADASNRIRKRRHCTIEGCTKYGVQGGVCTTHGGQRTQCKRDGCTNQSRHNGWCRRHDDERGLCTVDECENWAKYSCGLCSRHGSQGNIAVQKTTKRKHRDEESDEDEHNDMGGAAQKSDDVVLCTVIDDDDAALPKKAPPILPTALKRGLLALKREDWADDNEDDQGSISNGENDEDEGVNSTSNLASEESLAKIDAFLRGRNIGDTTEEDVAVDSNSQLPPMAKTTSKNAKFMCKVDGCNKRRQNKGLCSGHGGQYKCKHDGCNSNRLKGGYCKKHGGDPVVHVQQKRQCRHEACQNWVQRGGFCFTHCGAQHLCKTEGCGKWSRREGYCYNHGSNPLKCTTDGCNKPAVKRGQCEDHGARKRPFCSVEGCQNFVHERARGAHRVGLCQKHGGYMKMCQFEGCPNQAAKKGLCDRHGAEREIVLCEVEGCKSRQRRQKICRLHWMEKGGKNFR